LSAKISAIQFCASLLFVCDWPLKDFQNLL